MAFKTVKMLKNETIAVEITILLISGDLRRHGYNNNHLNIITTGFMVKKTHLLYRSEQRSAILKSSICGPITTSHNFLLCFRWKSYNSYGHWRACHLKLNLNICFYGFAETADSAFFPWRLTWAKCKSQRLRLDFGFGFA